MARKRKTKDVVEYLSVDAPLPLVAELEDKQSRYIHEYARANCYRIVKTVRRHGFSESSMNRQWREFEELIRKRRVDGIILIRMNAVASNLSDAYSKIGRIVQAGGIVAAVDQGELNFKIGWISDND